MLKILPVNGMPIQRFEHKELLIGEEGFERDHWEILDRYNQENGGCFFALTSKGIKFNQYVGVLQVGNLTIEILPKISQHVEEEDKYKWQRVLIDMLQECRWMKVHAQHKSSLRSKPNSILEAYLELYVQECEILFRAGLIKKYRAVERNCTALKGKLLFSRQLQLNIIHKERFYTRLQVYDKDNIYNQILFKALQLIPSLSRSPLLRDRVNNLLISFPDLTEIKITPSTFEQIVYTRKSTHYRDAIEIAAMLLLNYRPDISKGQNQLLAILFDMNDLWEEYFFRQLVKHKPENWEMESQNSKAFWQLINANASKSIRPDIIIKNKTTNTKIVLDTKWKVPDNDIPADSDLKQMFVYNEYWGAKNSILVYPYPLYSDFPKYIKGAFEEKENKSQESFCGIMKVSVLDSTNSRLDSSMGLRVNNLLKEQVL
jgi:5-methylcytosine-specific restriction enzyme subunit McrC